MARHKIMKQIKSQGFSAHSTMEQFRKNNDTSRQHLLSELPEAPVGQQLHTKSSEWTLEAKPNELSVL